MLLLFTLGNESVLRFIYTKYGQNSSTSSYLTREDTHTHTQNMVISKAHLYPLKERNKINDRGKLF
jgi:hypothetical protein